MRPAVQLCEDEMNGSRPAGRTLVVGLGTTGLAVARYLASRGETVRVIDSRAQPPGLKALRAAHPHLEVVTESLHPRWLEGVSQVVLSPGLGLDIGVAAEARRRGIPLVGEIELFARAARAPVVAVTGSKPVEDADRIYSALDNVRSKYNDMVLVHGGGPGAEKIAARWAESRNVHQIVCRPDWNAHGKAAPFRRNDQLLSLLPKGLISFPGSGISENLVDKAIQLGIPVKKYAA